MARNYDVTLNDGTVELGLMLYQDSKTRKQIRTGWTPSSPGLQEQTYRDWKNGFGYSAPGIVNDGYSYGLNFDGRSPGVAMPSGAITEVDISGLANIGPINDGFSLGDHTYFLAGRSLVKVLNGYSTVSVAADAGSGKRFTNATVAAYNGTSYAWIGGEDFNRWDGTTMTSAGTGSAYPHGPIGKVYWATTDGVSVQRLVGANTSFSVVHCPLTTDPMTSGNWSSSITVGEGIARVWVVISTGRHIYLSTNIGVYDMDDLGQTVNLAPYHADSTDVNNGVRSTYWDGAILYGAGTGIDAIDITQPGVAQGIANWAMPGATVGIPNQSPIWGRATAFTNDAGWVVAAIYNGTDSYIVYGKRRARLGFPGPGEWVWHGALAKFANQHVSYMTVRTVVDSGTPSRRLWIATGADANGTAPIRLYWQSLPLTTTARQDAIVSTAHRYATSWSLYNTPTTYGTYKSKTAIDAIFDSRSLGTSNTLALSISTDESSYGSTLGTVDESPIATLALASNDVEGSQFTPLVTATGTATVPSVLHSLTLVSSVDPDPNEVFDFDVVISREMQTGHGGTPTHNSPEVAYADLALMQGKVVTLTDPMGTPYEAVIEAGLPGAIQEIDPSPEGTRGWGRKVSVRAEIVERPSRYGIDRYGLAYYG